MPSPLSTTALSSTQTSRRRPTTRSSKASTRSSRPPRSTNATSYPSHTSRTTTARTSRPRKRKTGAPRSEITATNETLTRAFETLYKDSEASKYDDTWDKPGEGRRNNNRLWRDIGRISKQYSSLFPDDTYEATTTTPDQKGSLASFRSSWEGARGSESAITDFSSHMGAVRGLKAALAQSRKKHRNGLKAAKRRAKASGTSTAGRGTRTRSSTSATSAA